MSGPAPLLPHNFGFFTGKSSRDGDCDGLASTCARNRVGLFRDVSSLRRPEVLKFNVRGDSASGSESDRQNPRHAYLYPKRPEPTPRPFSFPSPNEFMAAQRSSSSLLQAMSRRIALFLFLLLLVHVLLSSPWNLLLSIRTGYNSAGWKALYAFVLYGAVFGLLFMGVALAVAVPTTVITWITILVLLAFFGKSRQGLLAESHRIIADITGFVFKFFHRRRH